MLYTAAALAAAGRRLHPVQVLALVCLLGSLSFVLHGQYQVHSELNAAQKELRSIKSLIARDHVIQGSDSSHTGAVRELISVVQAQQQLLDACGSDSKQHAQQLQQKADRLIGQLLLEDSTGKEVADGLHDDATVLEAGAAAAAAAAATSARDGQATASTSSPVPPPKTPFWRAEQRQAAGGGNAFNMSSVPPGTLCIDMTELLGLPQFMSGITWEPKNCFTGLAKIFTNVTEQAAIKQRLLADLTAAMARARGVQPEAINTTAKWWAAIKGQPPAPPRAVLTDPAFLRWQVALVRVLTRYMVRTDNRFVAVSCPGAPWSEVALAADDLPLPACDNLTDVALIQHVGRHGMPYDTLQTIVHVAMSYGLCTVPARDGHATYGDFLMSRVMNPQWRTFHTNNLEEDAVVFLWDILYQAREVFFKQRWLGVTAMQSPFDFMAIADIIHEVQPDVILETGTANGGSALMWASLLELNGLHNSTVITMDFAQPGAPEAFGSDSKAPATLVTATGHVVVRPNRPPQTDPVRHHLWKKYVEFVQGSSVDASSVARVKALIQSKQHQLHMQADAGGSGRRWSRTGSSSKPSRHILGVSKNATAGAAPPGEAPAAGGGRQLRVLVLLDSHHSAVHVLSEMEAYCTLVTPGSFCIVEDTKLTRWTDSEPGPLAAVRSFIGWHPEFKIDRDRELLFTHHPYGYLQRLY